MKKPYIKLEDRLAIYSGDTRPLLDLHIQFLKREIAKAMRLKFIVEWLNCKLK
jgi:hypothetical protein